MELRKPQKRRGSFAAECGRESWLGAEDESKGGQVLKKKGLESATGARGEKGGEDDEMEGEIWKEDLKREKQGRQRARECGEGSGNWEEWKAKSFEDCISCTVWKGYGSFSDIDVLDWG